MTSPPINAVSLELGPAQPITPLPVFSGADMTRALRAYRELQQALDREMPDQIITIRGRPFRRKGYWRAIRTAFNLNVTLIEERRAQVDGPGSDWGWLVTYRATAPNGRSADGDGCCYASEKSRGQMPATEHNVRSHAHTRAFNRAVSNLCGFGEVSAEEVSDDRVGSEGVAATPPRRITPAQQRRLFTIATKAGWDKETMRRALIAKFNVQSTAAITRDQYDAIIEYFSAPPAVTKIEDAPLEEAPF